MSVAVVGAGAIGGLLGAHLARSGEEVVLIARGAHLKAMQAHGLTVRDGSGEFVTHPSCTDDMDAIAGADVVFITLKAHSIPAVAPRIGEVLRPSATVVGAMNGIPWWYFADRHLESVTLAASSRARFRWNRLWDASCIPPRRSSSPE